MKNWMKALLPSNDNVFNPSAKDEVKSGNKRTSKKSRSCVPGSRHVLTVVLVDE